MIHEYTCLFTEKISKKKRIEQTNYRTFEFKINETNIILNQ